MLDTKVQERNFENTVKSCVLEEKQSYTITNGILTVSILTKGAELSSLKTKTMEYLWQANPEYWPRHAPILFPIVGPLKDGEYIYKNKKYPMAQHGFARDYDFKVIEKHKNSIVLEQRANDETKKIYPFNYILQVHYTLENKQLKVEYVVKNPSSDVMCFSIGAHPAFNCPFEAGQKRSDYQLVFDKKLSPKAKKKEGPFFVEKYMQVFDEPGILELPDGRFDDHVICFDPNPFSKVTFVHKPTGKKYLSVTFKNCPYLGIWSAGDSPFVCIEPWHGIADNVNHDKDFTKKEGIIKLEPKKTFTFRFTVEVY
ncbi:LACX protein [Yeosuana aromativorans]|uniref:LACX protein n=2 Tax=Yeosuana aromativorans TaxID=288019 RepID=A0A8J3BIF3_9FLAO|nr:LACX protein [Yeosuana aromativorans]